MISLLATLAILAPPSAQASPASSDASRLYIYEDDEVEGETPRPQESWIGGRPALHQGTLLRIRVSFQDRLHRMALDLP